GEDCQELAPVLVGKPGIPHDRTRHHLALVGEDRRRFGFHGIQSLAPPDRGGNPANRILGSVGTRGPVRIARRRGLESRNRGRHRRIDHGHASRDQRLRGSLDRVLRQRSAAAQICGPVGRRVVETVDAAGNVGAYSSLVLDADRNPHVSYIDVANGYLKYATKAGGPWTIETVDFGGHVDGSTSIALDGSGQPQIAYYDAAAARLRYASRSAGAWITETIDPTAGGGRLSSLVLDADGSP